MDAPSPLSRHYADYYNLLTDGFLDGKLSLAVPADPFLATLQNPWDPAQRGAHGMHDVSYFHGKYYLYFGVTPVLLLFLPVRLLGGLEIDQGVACLLFAWAGFGAAACLIVSLGRRYFPRSPVWAVAMAVAGLGLLDTMPLLLRRASIWEVPVTCAYACFMAALYCLFRAFHSPRRWVWMGLSSAAFGLAVGARPTYLPGHLSVAVNGKTVLSKPQASYPCSQGTILIGENIIGSSTADREFTGTMVDVAFRQM